MAKKTNYQRKQERTKKIVIGVIAILLAAIIVIGCISTAIMAL